LGGVTQVLKLFLMLQQSEAGKSAEFGCMAYIFEILTFTIFEYRNRENDEVTPLPTNSTLAAALHSAIPLVRERKRKGIREKKNGKEEFKRNN